MELDIRQYLTQAKERQDSGALRSAYQLMESAAVARTGGRTPRIAPELYVVCAEVALQVRPGEGVCSLDCIYFEGNPTANQFLCRAYLCQGQLKSPPTTGSVVRTVNLLKGRYYFMTFNASVLYFQTVRPLLQPGRCRHLVPSLRQVVGSLEEVADRDHSWRAELMMHLIKCLVDSREMEEAARFAKVTEEFIKSHIPHLYPRLFTLLYILALTARVVLSLLQERHSQTEVVIPQARLKEIGQLDQCLQTAVREGDPQAAQAVCATQWRFCLPLLQHNLRTHIRTPLLRVAQVLEDIQSMLLETRCQVHSELAVIEEEDGRLEASLTHLQKAMLLDDGTRQERLSSALRLLQLRGTLYQTPPRAEDKADLLMQTDSRPILVAVGLLLAPDDFQMVLDADNTSKSSLGSGPGARLSAKAQHHSTSVRKLDGHLARQGKDTDITERAKLWATLVKTARKQEVWDVCRAACRFCLLYDDGRLKISETDECRSLEEGSGAEGLHACSRGQICARDLLRLLAEIRFISAEVDYCQHKHTFQMFFH
uniref:Uncharacterized protein n=1 Tax=Cyclopterus lumpus TaxID=8103 RepID=A0A8C3GBE6_CYCLU